VAKPRNSKLNPFLFLTHISFALGYFRSKLKPRRYPYIATPTDNPYNVNHGYSNRYNYQAVFTPVGSTEPTPTPTGTSTGTLGGLTTETGIIIALVVIIIIILIAFGVFASRRKK
jgi:hypothetical protein